MHDARRRRRGRSRVELTRSSTADPSNDEVLLPLHETLKPHFCRFDPSVEYHAPGFYLLTLLPQQTCTTTDDKQERLRFLARETSFSRSPDSTAPTSGAIELVTRHVAQIQSPDHSAGVALGTGVSTHLASIPSHRLVGIGP
jgi:hypothetical protein